MSKRKLSLKWFGSLANLSSRRSSEKTASVAKHDGKCRPLAAAEHTVDDMDACVHGSGYACSSDMYTHVGTVPRRDRQRSRKGSRAKGHAGEEVSGGRQGQLWDSAADSVLLNALINVDQAGLDRPLPAPAPVRDLPLPSLPPSPPSPLSASTSCSPEGREASAGESQYAPLSCEDALQPAREAMEESQQKPGSALPTQELYVLMEPVAEVGRTAKTGDWAEATESSQEVRTAEGQPESTDYVDGSGEYVKFSRGRLCLEAPSEKLRKELEEELKLNSSDLRSHGWYHGPIPWEVSESLVVNHGDFLIRDSLSRHGHFVLTSFWNHCVLHFLISKTLVQSSQTYTCVSFTLEGEAFNSLPALVHYYVGNQAALTRQSGAQIHSPVNRTLPLRYLEAAFPAAIGRDGIILPPTSQRGIQNGEDKVCPWSPSTLHQRGAEYNRSLQHDRRSSSSGETPLTPPSTTNDLLGQLCKSGSDIISEVIGKLSHQGSQGHDNDAVFPGALDEVLQIFGCPALLAGALGLSEIARAAISPSLGTTLTITVYGEHGIFVYEPLDSGYTDDVMAVFHANRSKQFPSHPRSPCGSQVASVASSPTNTLHRHPDDTPRPHPPPIPERLRPDAEGGGYTELRTAPSSAGYVERLCSEDGKGVDQLRVENGSVYCSPVVENVSAFRPSCYRSPLMPAENKPLEVCILRRVKELLAEVEPKTAAKHITKADCMVARILEVEVEVQRRMGVSSGIELLTLPHGHQLRLDLMERFHTMSIMLAVDVLGCTGTTEERAGLLHKIIQIAAELKSNLGNMFGFAAIMRALELPQVTRLEQTWMALRQRHTEGAILYEKTLKPFMKRLNDGRESCPLSNTSFPHMVPLLTLLEKSVALGDGAEPWETVEAGVDVVMCHLAAARTMAQLGGIYRANAETKLQGFEERAEVLELFLTDFQMRLLWGSRGAEQDQTQRYAKFDQVLTALSNKLEPPSPP
ncbi:SH2 domain containing 3Cb [Lampris incognitus]|uniref:SH2 domain containing 3Cb n=1 Tax=Lampris incognitus TaxID=2546036 RepID=UPI0024B4E2BA|nr:SH2 domain containing 3Cb [Lampris incognitus]